jgi:hypothetical protein
MAYTIIPKDVITMCHSIDWYSLCLKYGSLRPEIVVEETHIPPSKANAVMRAAARYKMLYQHSNNIFSIHKAYADKRIDLTRQWICLIAPLPKVKGNKKDCVKCPILKECRQHVIQGDKMGCEL